MHLYKQLIYILFKRSAHTAGPGKGEWERGGSTRGEGGKRLTKKRYVSIRIKAYIRYIQPEWGEPSALYQHPGTISLFGKTICLHSNQSLSPLYRTRRGGTEHSPPESGHNKSFEKRYVFIRNRTYLRYIEPEGAGKPSALHQNRHNKSFKIRDVFIRIRAYLRYI